MSAPGPAELRGHLDHVDRDLIAGWARDPALPNEPVQLRVLNNGVAIGAVVADQYRGDLAAHGEGTGYHGFSLSVPAGLEPHLRHVIRVQYMKNGEELPNSPQIIEAAPGSVPPPIIVATANPDRTIQGHIDLVTRELVAGWAYDPRTPDIPVALQIIDNGTIIARILANRYRDDLAKAEIGTGRHAFEIRIPGGFSPLLRHVIRVCNEVDGAELYTSPRVIESVSSFGPALEQVVTNAVGALMPNAEQRRVLDFLVAQTDRLLKAHAAAEGQRSERMAYQRFHRRWGPAGNMVHDVPDPGKRALIIDQRVPVPMRDAGSQAILSHIGALQRLGYAVSFAASEEMMQPGETLEERDIAVCGEPFYASVEDVLRRQGDCFDLVYLHRIDIATQYLALVRRWCPRARLVYSVADLHHLRLQRQAVIEERPDLTAASHRLRLSECVAAWSADAVITHSGEEAQLLRRAVPQAHVHQVPWDVPLRQPLSSFAKRGHVAFIGGYAHTPNVDAACFLVRVIMPLVWQMEPSIECLLVGSDMPIAVRRLTGPGIIILGHVDDLGTTIFDQVRLTVAPLRYGAGIKGKVLDSFAAGVPCVMSAIAAEGLALPLALQRLVGANPTELAALICRLHADETANQVAAAAGVAMIRKDFCEEAVTSTLQAAIEGRRPAAGSTLPKTYGPGAAMNQS